MGVVYKVTQLNLRRPVALKMILGGAYARTSEIARFIREAEVVASLHHPHIVQVYDVGDLDGRPYFTMEYVEGGSLGHKLSGTPQPARDAAELLATLARAVQAAHDAGIVHRDLKPGNVLLAADGTPKITDFGLARHFGQDEDLTVSGGRIGTPCYMAPEQAAGRASAVGPTADVYSLGAILYELLTGRPPFRAETAAATVQQVIHQEPAPPSRLNAKVPRDLETICLNCLHKDPERRYAGAAALADDIGRFREGLPILARPPGWAGRVRRWARREPAAAALVATGLVAAALAVGGGFWVERQRADTRAAEARREGQVRQAVEAALAHAEDLQKLGHWPEARAALVGAPDVLGTAVPAAVGERLRRARADAGMVVALEDVRLRLSEGSAVVGRASPIADRLYAEAFAKYGIDLANVRAADAAALVRRSGIRDILLVFLHDWLYWAPDANLAKLRDVVEEADDDPWRRAFRDARARVDFRKLVELARAPEADSQPTVLLSGLGGMLLAEGHRAEAWALLRRAQRRHPEDFWINFLLGHFLEEERPQEAAGYSRVAVAIRPNSSQAYSLLGRCLREAGDADGAVAALREAFDLNPSRSGIGELATALAPAGRFEEVRAAWEKMLRTDPPDQDAWYGYAQLCLFLGHIDEYRRARAAILQRFGATNDWIVAERTSLASLLLPVHGDELRPAVALAERAVAAASKSASPDNPSVLFLAGLAEYREGRFAQAEPLLRNAALNLPNRPGPRIVLAMVQFRAGAPVEARRTLAAAVASYNWTASQADHTTVWVSHVLRREAEAMILPNLSAFLQGRHRPQDNDERLALLGVCQFRGRYRAAAQLYADAFAADPTLADDSTAKCLDRAARETGRRDRLEVLKTEPRYLAARCAVLAGCGDGDDGPKVAGAERSRWRRQAHDWLRADLAAWATSLTGESEEFRDAAQDMLTLWRVDADLSRVREPGAVDELSAAEREEWAALWGAVRRALQEP
jgi:serine/threonine-protein kinase